jgi:hypothetical protein
MFDDTANEVLTVRLGFALGCAFLGFIFLGLPVLGLMSRDAAEYILRHWRAISVADAA